MRSIKLEVIADTDGRGADAKIQITSGAFEASATLHIQGDMIQERLEDVVNPHLRRLANDLDTELKRLRQVQKK